MSKMLTIFACPKSFEDKHIRNIQRNAIRSWLLLEPRPQVILLGNEVGIAETCAEFSIRHVPHVKTNEYGTPLLNDVFENAERLATGNLLCYVNADIMLARDFSRALEITVASKPRFLLGGRPWNLDVSDELPFNAGGEEIFRDRAVKEAQLRSPRSCDFFAFPRGLWGELPPFALGRAYFDNALLYRARRIGAALVDATQAVVAIHQNHDYPSHLDGAHKLDNREAKRNVDLADGPGCLFTWKSATHVVRGGRLRFNLPGYIRILGPESPVTKFIRTWFLTPLCSLRSSGAAWVRRRANEA
jgi:hypothetical protein